MKHRDRHAALRPGDLPPPDADFDAINEFGHAFDGYEHAEARWPDEGALEACCDCRERARASIAGGGDAVELALDDLRAALLTEMRQARQMSQWDDLPDDDCLGEYPRLVSCIRSRVADGAAPARRLAAEARPPSRATGTEALG